MRKFVPKLLDSLEDCHVRVINGMHFFQPLKRGEDVTTISRQHFRIVLRVDVPTIPVKTVSIEAFDSVNYRSLQKFESGNVNRRGDEIGTKSRRIQESFPRGLSLISHVHVTERWPIHRGNLTGPPLRAIIVTSLKVASTVF